MFSGYFYGRYSPRNNLQNVATNFDKKYLQNSKKIVVKFFILLYINNHGNVVK